MNVHWLVLSHSWFHRIRPDCETKTLKAVRICTDVLQILRETETPTYTNIHLNKIKQRKTKVNVTVVFG